MRVDTFIWYLRYYKSRSQASDAYTTYDLGKYLTILPQKPIWDLNKFIKKFNAKKVKEGLSYSSNQNDKWLSVDELRLLIKANIDSEFQY